MQHSIKHSITKQQGLTIIEFMISIVLSAMLIFGVIQIFESNKQSYNLTKSFSRVQEGGRIASEIMARDIRTADFWGCTQDVADITNHFDTSGTDVDYDAALDPTTGTAISGVDEISSGSIGSITVRPLTDTFTVKGSASRRDVRVVSPYVTSGSSRIHITSGVSIPLGQQLLITDCNGGDIFSNTLADTTGGAVEHTTTAFNTGLVGAVNNSFAALAREYDASAQILEPFVKTYFIGQPSTGVWSLYRQENGETSELVRDIEDLDVVYGVDTGIDGSVDVYQNASAVSNWDKVISVRATLTMSEDDVSTAAITRSYTITANIRNRSL